MKGILLPLTRDLNGNCELPRLIIETVEGRPVGTRTGTSGNDPYLFVATEGRTHAPAGLALI